jgi:hypothetical protein
MPMSAPLSATIVPMKRTSAAAPWGVAQPTVSVTQTRRAPQAMAVEYSRRSVVGSARMVSSVTYITVSPSRTANDTDSSVSRSR